MDSFCINGKQLNLLYREEEREMLPLCKEEKIAVIPWSPLAGGKLTRNWEDKTVRSEKDSTKSTFYNADTDRLIVGATKLSHLEDAVAALSIKLTPEEIAYLEEPYVPHQIVGFK
jgi:1-deoxyxylulose-5-phosphate synthase